MSMSMIIKGNEKYAKHFPVTNITTPGMYPFIRQHPQFPSPYNASPQILSPYNVSPQFLSPYNVSPQIPSPLITHPLLYRFNDNLSTIFGQYKIQPYDATTGRLMPSYTPQGMLNDMIESFKSKPEYVSSEKVRVQTSLYNNESKKFTVGFIGSKKDIDIARIALDEYFTPLHI